MNKLTKTVVETLVITSLNLVVKSIKDRNQIRSINEITLRKEEFQMTVKCIKQDIKDQIAASYRNKYKSIKQLAIENHTSPRTIGRVLEEHGLATPVPRLKGEAYHAMKLLEKFNVSVEELEQILINYTKKP
jgi:hypothetical protein